MLFRSLEKTDSLFANKFGKMSYQPITERIQVYSPELLALKDDIKMLDEAMFEKSSVEFFELLKAKGAIKVNLKKGVIEIKC